MMDMKRAEKVANKGSRARDPVHFKLFEWRREACVRAHSPIPICLSPSLSLSLSLSSPFPLWMAKIRLGRTFVVCIFDRRRAEKFACGTETSRESILSLFQVTVVSLSL